ncbi:MAG: ABC transporter ATP-binding protein, partial [Saccharopolyspora rectivirgula]
RGRHPHQAWYRQWSSDDESAVADALELTGIAELADRALDELSGGQRQRAWISMALAQGTDLLLLDEPTTYLDLSHQVDVLELVNQLHAENGRTVVMVLHDLNLAARYADRLVAMKDGAVVAEGEPGEVLTEALLAEVFGLSAKVVPDPVAGTPMVVPVGGRRVLDKAD